MAVNEGEVIYTICTRRNGQSSIREEENQEFKVEAYRVLNSHLKQSGSAALPQLSDRFHEIVPLTLNDAGAANDELAVAALQFLSYSLYDQSLANISQAEVIVPVLCELALRQPTVSSEVITQLLWCLANHKMNCSTSLLTAHVRVQVLMISQLIMLHKHSSFTVHTECLNLLHRMHRDYEGVFVALDPIMWYPSLVTLLTADNQKNVTMAYQLAKKLEPLLVGNHDIACSLVDSLKEKLASLLYKQFINLKIEQTTLLIWQHFVCVLDKQLHNYGNWFNTFLKIVEQAFKHSDSQVQIAAYKAWRTLIDNYSLNLRILTGSRRMKLIMTPLVGFPAHVRDEEVDVERFVVWQHLIECLGNKRVQSMKQVITPLLLFSMGIDSRIPSAVLDEWALDGACISITPATPTSEDTTENVTKVCINIVHHHGDEATVISSPRIHPGIIYHSLLQSCCQLVMSLCGFPPTHQISGAVVPVINCGDGKGVFMKQPRIFLLFVEAILQLSPIVTDEVCRGVWQAVFQCVTTALTDPGILSVSPLMEKLISILRVAIVTNKFQQLTVDMVTQLCNLYHQIPFKLSSEELLVVSSLNNKKVYPWLFLLEVILHQPLILQKIQIVTMVTLFKFSFANGRDYINNASSIVDMLKQSVPSNKEHRWQLFEVWLNLMSTLTDKVVKVDKLCTDSSADHMILMFSDVLIYPVELLYSSAAVASSVPIEVRAKLIPSWTKLIDAVTVAMVTTSELPPSINELITVIGNKLVEFLQEQEAEMYMLCALTKMCASLIDHSNFSKGDPSRVSSALLKLLQWILLKTSQSQEISQGAMATSLFTSLTGVLIKTFTLLHGNELITAALDHVIPHVTNLFDGLHNQFDGNHSTLYASLRKVWSSIAMCLQARYTGSYSSELLRLLSPLLVLMLSLRDRGRHNNSLCSLMLTFWCATFAKEATLVYPEKLCDALKQFRHMGGRIELPGWPCDEVVTAVCDSLNGQEDLLEVGETQNNCSYKTHSNRIINSLGTKGKKYLRARRKLPLDYYNSENMEITPVTKKKRLLSRHRKDYCRERQRSHDASKQLNSLDHSSQNGHHGVEELSIDENSQSDESFPVPMVIACEANDNGINDVSSPSLLFDSNTPVSTLPVTILQSSISNSQANSMETEQDSVSTIPDSAEEGVGLVSCSSASAGVTKPTRDTENDNTNVENINVTDSNNGIGEIPSSDNSCLHLMDHSYTMLNDGVGGADSCEQLKCREKMGKYSAMITPVTRKSIVLLKDNDGHAARCSGFRGSNKTLIPVRRYQCQVTSNKNTVQKESPLDLGHVTSSVMLPVSAVEGNSITTRVNSNPEATVTQSTGTVTQPRGVVTQLVDTVTQVKGDVTQIDKDKQLLETSTKGHSTVACTQAGETRPCVVTHSDMTGTQNVAVVVKDTVTQLNDKITQSTDTVTHLQHSPHTATLSSSNLSNPQNFARHQQQHIVPTPIVLPPMQQYSDLELVTKLAIGTISTALHSIHGNQFPCISNQSLRRPSPLVTGDATSKMACLYGMLSSCLVTSLPITVSTSAMPHVTSSHQLLPTIQNVFGNVNSNQLPFSNRQLPGIIRQRQPNLFISTPTSKNLLLPSTPANSSSVMSTTPSNSSRVMSLAPSISSSVMSLTPSMSSSVMSLTPSMSSSAMPLTPSNSSSVVSLTPSNSSSVMSSTLSKLSSVMSSTPSNSSSVMLLTLANSSSAMSLTSANSSSVMSLTPSNSSSVMSPTPANLSIVMSLISSNSSSVMSLTPSNSSSVMSLTPSNSSSVMSPTPANSSSVMSLISSNSSSVMSPTPANSSSVMSLISSNSSSVMSPTPANSSSVMSLISSNSSSVMSPTPSNSSSVMLPTQSNSSSFKLIQAVKSPHITVVTSASSPVMSAKSGRAVLVTPVDSNALQHASSPSLYSPTVSSVNSLAVTSLTSDSASNTFPHVTLKQTKSNAKVSASNSPVAVETVTQVEMPQGKSCKRSVDNSDSPPHTPTSGILKRISQFDTPTTSGKRRRVSFADTVEDLENYDVCSDRRYVTSPRSKLHSKASPRRLLAKPDKMNNTGRTKSPPVDHESLPSYPALRSCDAPIDMILPDLISSPMARSLGKLFHAREIRTIGNLASLPENQVKSLPIQPPKLQTLRTTLESFEKQLEQNASKVTNADKLTQSSSMEQLATVIDPSSSDHVITSFHDPCVVTDPDHVSINDVTITTTADHVSSDDVIITTTADHVSSDDVMITTTADKQNSVVETVNQPAPPPIADDTSCAIDDNSTATGNDEPSATPTRGCGVIQDIPVSGSGPLEQPLSDRMQYLTESCSYDNTNDSLILATPESQPVMEDGQHDVTNTTCLNEDPLVVTDNDHQTHANEGNSLQDDVINNTIPNVSLIRKELHVRLQKLIAGDQFREHLSALNHMRKSIKENYLDSKDYELFTSVVLDTLDYYKVVGDSKS